MKLTLTTKETAQATQFLTNRKLDFICNYENGTYTLTIADDTISKLFLEMIYHQEPECNPLENYIIVLKGISNYSANKDKVTEILIRLASLSDESAKEVASNLLNRIPYVIGVSVFPGFSYNYALDLATEYRNAGLLVEIVLK